MKIISFNPFAGAGNSMSEYQSAICSRNLLRNLQRGDRAHHPIAELLINCAAFSFEIGGGEMNGFADNDGDRAEAQFAAVAWKRPMRAENPHRHHGCERFRNDETHARERGL